MFPVYGSLFSFGIKNRILSLSILFLVYACLTHCQQVKESDFRLPVFGTENLIAGIT